MMDKYDIAIIIVDYKSAAETLRYIQQCRGKLAGSYKICYVVADNSCDEQNYKVLTEGLQENKSLYFDGESRKYSRVATNAAQDVFAIQMLSNAGFAGGNNAAAKFAIQYCHVSYLLFSNNDIRMEDDFNLSFLIHVFSEHPNVSVVGPQVIGIDGRIQSPCRYVDLYDRWWKRQLLFPLGKLFKAKRYTMWLKSDGRMPDAENSEVYRVIGAFMLCDADKFTEAGGFDGQTFLYAEEPILSERMKKIGYSTWYCPEQSVTHLESATISKAIADEKKREKIRLDSELYYYKEYMHYSPLAIRMTRVIFELYYLKEHLVEAIKNRRK